jgi:hypothetical protein
MSGNTEWVKASASAASGDCVEMRRHDNRVQIRDSKNPDGAILTFSGVQIAAWLEGARRGEFDGLAR